MFLHRRSIPGLAIHSYLIGDDKSKRAAVIDPVRDVGPYLDIARSEGMHITHVLETHVHADFVSGSAELKDRLGDDVTIVCSKLGGAEWTPPYADIKAGEGEVIELGKSVRLVAMHTPGHTPEHVSWMVYDTARSNDVPWLTFSGDFLFVGDVGRPDLLGEAERQRMARQLYASLFEKMPALPDYTEIFPAHGAGSLCGKAIGSRDSSTMGYERKFSASWQKKPVDQWVSALLDGMPIAPPYFKQMKRINRDGPAIIGENLPGQRRMSATQVGDALGVDCILLDVRTKEAFAAAHVPGSINIQLGSTLPTWAGWVLDYDKRLILLTNTDTDAATAALHLIRVGFDRIDGFLEGGIGAWQTAGLPTDQLQLLDVQALKRRMAEVFVLDVRTDGEWASGHIDSAHHIHAGLLRGRMDELPRDRLIAVTCGSGFRASIAASLLKRAGIANVANVVGGMTAWKEASA